ncbi:hypothetical protein HD554DRAFT_2105198, partial [Boletus coccyginus]
MSRVSANALTRIPIPRVTICMSSPLRPQSALVSKICTREINLPLKQSSKSARFPNTPCTGLHTPLALYSAQTHPHAKSAFPHSRPRPPTRDSWQAQKHGQSMHMGRATPRRGGGVGRTAQGPVASISERALALFDKVMDNATWRNLHWLPHQVLVYEVRVEEGYGIRWSQDRSQLVGEDGAGGSVDTTLRTP